VFFPLHFLQLVISLIVCVRMVVATQAAI
jgi:hypothetical protein